MSDPIPQSEGWSALLKSPHASRLATLALAIWLHAANSMLTATTLPSAVEEIGGLNLMHWAFALYLAGSIAAGASINLFGARLGITRTLQACALIYALGCLVCALAPSMPILLGGRVLQGLGGGGLVGMVYVCQAQFFPNHLVPRVVAAMSLIWMLAAFAGPTIGGLFASFGIWRYAFWAFGFQAGLLIVAVHYLIADENTSPANTSTGIPVIRLLALSLAILSMSASGIRFDPVQSPLYLGFGIACLYGFIIRDLGAADNRMLPMAIRDLAHPVSNGIAATFFLCLSIMSFVIYGPLLLIRMYGLSPLEAGLVVMLESLAWGMAALVFSSAPAHRERAIIRTGSALVTVGLVAMALALPSGDLMMVIVCSVISSGGMGMMWGFVIRQVVVAAPPPDQDRTSTLLPITQQVGFALGAALSGLFANGFGLNEDMTSAEMQRVAFWLFAGFLPLGLVGNLFTWRFTHKRY